MNLVFDTKPHFSFSYIVASVLNVQGLHFGLELDIHVGLFPNRFKLLRLMIANICIDFKFNFILLILS